MKKKLPGTLILASASPRRKMLLKEAGISFQVVKPDVEELSINDCAKESLPLRNAQKKASAVSEMYPNDIVLGADTVVELNGNIIEKPEDAEHAKKMLMMLSEKKHKVVTGVSILRKSDYTSILFAETSCVKFKNFSAETAEKYMNKVFVLDKAGAYAVQEYGEMIIKKITGSVSNVIGLPVEKVLIALNLIMRDEKL